MGRNLAVFAAVAAVVLAEHGEALDVCGVDVRECPTHNTNADVSMQAAGGRDWPADVARVARAAVVLGCDHVRFYRYDGYVQVVVVGEVSTPAGTARVQVWDHLTGDDIDQAARLLGIGLDRDTDPVFVSVPDVVRRLDAMPMGMRVGR
jgi:hypothetical protein